MADTTSVSPPPIPPRWCSLSGKPRGSTTTAQQKQEHSASGTASPSDDYDSAEEKVRLAPNMSVITKAIREKKSQMVLDERYMSSEEALSLSPPGEELESTDEFGEEDDTYDVDDLLDDIFEEEEAIIWEVPKKVKKSYFDRAVALSITILGRAKVVEISNPSPTTSSSDADDEAENLRRCSKASKRDVPFIAVPHRLRPLSIIKPVEIRDDGSQSADSPDFWTAVPMFGDAIIPPRSDSIGQRQQPPATVSRTATEISESHSEGSTSPSTISSSILLSPTETNTSASVTDSPPMPQRQSSLLSLHNISPTSTTTSTSTSLLKSLGTKFTTTLARKPKIDSLLEASNGLANNTMSSGAGVAQRKSSLSHHRRGGSLNFLGNVGRSHSGGSAFTTRVIDVDQDVEPARPKMEARGASERVPVFQLPPSPTDVDAFGVRAEGRDVSKQLTRRPVGAEPKRRSLMPRGVGRRGVEA